MAAASEVKAFRALLKTWLGTVSGLTAKVSTRIYHVLPPIEADYPCCAYNIALRESVSDVGLPAWNGSAEVILHGPRGDDLDDAEDALVDACAQQQDAIQASLTDSTVQTTMFRFTRSTQDWRDAYEESNFIVLVRVLSFEFSFVKRTGAWA